MKRVFKLAGKTHYSNASFRVGTGLSTLVYRYWLLPVNSPCISENTCFPREVMIAIQLGSISVPVFTNIIQDTVRK